MFDNFRSLVINIVIIECLIVGLVKSFKPSRRISKTCLPDVVLEPAVAREISVGKKDDPQQAPPVVVSWIVVIDSKSS